MDDIQDFQEEIIKASNLVTLLRERLVEAEAHLASLINSVPQPAQKPVRAQDQKLVDLLAILDRKAEADAWPEAPGTPPNGRRSKYPEGPPLNRKVLQCLQRAKGPVDWAQVMKEVPANRQSIQATLRDLGRRGHAAKTADGRWIAKATAGNLVGVK
jgi:hypothetical protein